MLLITGATGYTGGYLVRDLVSSGERVACLLRPGSDSRLLEALGVEIRRGDLADRSSLESVFLGVRAVIHLAHIRYTENVLDGVPRSVDRVVLVSSLRVLSRVPSLSVDAVKAGEAAAAASSVPWVMLRPNMIYGPGDDRNISRLTAFVRRHRWFPVFGNGRARQQPVHVFDVVQAVRGALGAGARIHATYTIAGPTSLSYNRLIDEIGANVGRRPVKIHIPVGAALWVLRWARFLGVRLPLSREEVLRLQEDKHCSIDAARADLGFAPMEFRQGLTRLSVCGGVRP